MQALEGEEDRLWQDEMQSAFKAADAARTRYRAEQEVGLGSCVASSLNKRMDWQIIQHNCHIILN